MAKAYYSTMLDRPAGEVWAAIRAFDHYSWAGTGIEATMENGVPGDAVGGIRRVETANGLIRQRLLAHSDLRRSYTYEFAGGMPYPVANYVATLRVTPIVDGDQAFVEWWATFDCAPEEAGIRDSPWKIPDARWGNPRLAGVRTGRRRGWR